MADLKKKIYEILFEEDEPEIEADENITVFKSEKTADETLKDEPTIKAKDILYRKSDIFVDLNESPKTAEEFIGSANEPYVLSTQISPIFGLIKEDKKKTNTYDSMLNESQTNKPSDSHLDIITSPIYGYGNKEEVLDKIDSYIDDGEEEMYEDEQLHNLFDDEDRLNDSLDKLNEDEEISLFKLFGEK